MGEGASLVRKTNTEFSEVSSSVSRSGELVGEIAAASREQAQGIEQVNRAMSEMDKVTQKNAANAEESASASEEMNAQAAQMRDFVAEIAVLVGRDETKAKSATVRTVATVKKTDPKPAGRHVKALPKRAGGTRGEELAPRQVIPFDDDMQGF